MHVGSLATAQILFFILQETTNRRWGSFFTRIEQVQHGIFCAPVLLYFAMLRCQPFCKVGPARDGWAQIRALIILTLSDRFVDKKETSELESSHISLPPSAPFGPFRWPSAGPSAGPSPNSDAKRREAEPKGRERKRKMSLRIYCSELEIALILPPPFFLQSR